MAIIGTITDGYLYFNAVAGKTYTLSIENTNGEFTADLTDVITSEWENLEFIGGNAFDGTPFTFTPTRSFQARIYLDGGNLISFVDDSSSVVTSFTST
jgi:hypothetical protein